jgi:hypothetical protein
MEDDNDQNNIQTKTVKDAVTTLTKTTNDESKLADPDLKEKTDFGRKLVELRNQAIAEGMTLLNHEEILAEIASRRVGI